MKQIIFIFLVSSSLSFSQKTDFDFGAKPDSLLKETEFGYIYITSDTSSNYYDWIIPTIDTEMVQSIQNQYFSKEYEKINLSKSHFNLGSFPRKWNSVYRYQNEYFLYAPSDWMSNLGLIITDSIIYHVQSDWDPVSDYMLQEFKSTDNEKTEIKANNLLGQEFDISIQIVDRSLGIYEWSLFNNEVKSTVIFLMQNSDYSNKLRMIVCDCGDRKCLLEFDFKE
jgi:hypothetical protein